MKVVGVMRHKVFTVRIVCTAILIVVDLSSAEATDNAEAPEAILVEDAELAEDEDEDEDIEYEDDGDIQPNMLPRPGREDCVGNRFVTVVDTSGIHHLPIVKCLCPTAAEEHLQYLELGLFPSSYQLIKTLFTFGVLADFRLSNLECKTTAYQYYSKLRRLTCPAFPKTVLNRYTELRRLSRQYRNLKLWKMHGHGYEMTETPEAPLDNQRESPEGTDPAPNANVKTQTAKPPLALFCPACPQPLVNLPDNWDNDQQWWLYIRKFCADGNFKADHLNQVNPAADVELTAGEAFMTAEDAYTKHIKEAVSKAPKYNQASSLFHRILCPDATEGFIGDVRCPFGGDWIHPGCAECLSLHSAGIRRTLDCIRECR